MTAQTHSLPLGREQQLAPSRAEALKAALAAALLGLALVYVADFSQAQTLHNGAHDTRHALSFPCH